MAEEDEDAENEDGAEPGEWKCSLVLGLKTYYSNVWLSLDMHMTALETMTSNHPFIKHPHVNLIFHTITATVRVHPLWSEGAGGVWGD